MATDPYGTISLEEHDCLAPLCNIEDEPDAVVAKDVTEQEASFNVSQDLIAAEDQPATVVAADNAATNHTSNSLPLEELDTLVDPTTSGICENNGDRSEALDEELLQIMQASGLASLTPAQLKARAAACPLTPTRRKEIMAFVEEEARILHEAPIEVPKALQKLVERRQLEGLVHGELVGSTIIEQGVNETNWSDQHATESIHLAHESAKLTSTIIQEAGEASGDAEHSELDNIKVTRNFLGGFGGNLRKIGVIMEDWNLGDDETQPRHPAANHGSPPSKPHQCQDADWIVNMAESGIGSAILASDCGTGKTHTTMLAFVEHIERTIRERSDPSYRVPSGGKRYRHSVYECPPAVVSQVQSEHMKWWSESVRLYTSYGRNTNHTVLSAMDELIQLDRRLSSDSDNPETQRWLILIPYTTADRRLIKSVGDQYVTADDMEAQRRGWNCNDEPEPADADVESDVDEEQEAPDDEGVDEGVDEAQTVPTKRKKATGRKGKAKRAAKRPRKTGVSRRVIVPAIEDMDIDWFIADDAHYLKNPMSHGHSLVTTIKRQFNLLVTATPLLNSIQDIIGYVDLIWRPEWPFQYHYHDSVGMDEFYDLDKVNALLRDTAAVDVDENNSQLTLHRLVSRGEGWPEHMMSSIDYTEEERIARHKYEDLVLKRHIPMHIMNPTLLVKCGQKHKWDINVSLKCVKPILQLVSLRRTMSTQVAMSNGARVTPGDDIPKMTVNTVEVNHSDQEARKVMKILNSRFHMLYTGQMQGGHQISAAGNPLVSTAGSLNQGIRRMLALVSTKPDFYKIVSPKHHAILMLRNRAVAQAIERLGISEEEYKRAMRRVRDRVGASHLPTLREVLSELRSRVDRAAPEEEVEMAHIEELEGMEEHAARGERDGDDAMLGTTDADRAAIDEILNGDLDDLDKDDYRFELDMKPNEKVQMSTSLLRRIADETGENFEEMKQRALQRIRNREIPGGVLEVNRIMAHDSTGGLRYIFNETRGDDVQSNVPETEVDMVQHVLTHSPKLCYVVRKVLELQDEKRRVLIFAYYPLTCMLIQAVLSALSIVCTSIGSRHSQEHRDKVIQDFRNPRSTVGAMVMPMQLGAFGLNLHEACADGIIIEEPHNLSIKMQVLGRLCRIGQTKEINWTIVYNHNTLDGYLRGQSVDKYIKTIGAESSLPGNLDKSSEVATICLYELLRLQLGERFSLYPAKRVNWRLRDHATVQREGLFFSALAQRILQHPDEAAEVQPENLGAIALRWEPGMEITREIISCAAPILMDSEGNETGLKLRRFNKNNDLIDETGEVMADVRNEYSDEQDEGPA